MSEEPVYSAHLEQVRGYLKALKIIISADGDIAEAELKALKKGMVKLGIPAAMMDEILAFDSFNTPLEAVLPALHHGGKKARGLIHDAIEYARADGTYAEGEKDAVEKAAQILGVDAHTVKALESLVELEQATRRLRKALL